VTETLVAPEPPSAASPVPSPSLVPTNGTAAEEKSPLTHEVFDLYKRAVIANYNRLPTVVVRGRGAEFWDAEGRRYLDMFPGWAVSSLGHCHPAVVEAIQKQAETLIHIDNTFYNEPQARLAGVISDKGFGGKCFFCNSGAEANEAALKLARRHLAGRKKWKYVTFEGGFHGRTFGALTATAQPKYHEGFGPLVPGFTYCPWNDAAALEAAVDDETAAILVEPIQGEGGVRVASEEFLRKAREIADRRGCLLIFDEVQSGCGRTGTWFVYQHFGVTPDIMTLAKAVGGGVPLGVMVAKPEIAAALVPGTHASTYGGNPLVCAAALAVFETIERENLLQKAKELACYTWGKLDGLKKDFPAVAEEVRGVGLMQAMQLSVEGKPLVSRCLELGLRINVTHETIIRFMPPMIASREQIDEAADIMRRAMGEVYG
jgi:acetylornithine/N-succinyldiaminopimelate aminotransferase